MTEETIKEILKFRDDRDWKQFHNPKDLAISISLEAAELLEVFQWSGADVSNEGKQEKIIEQVLKLDLKSMAEKIIADTVKKAEEGFESVLNDI